jgi:hypothetical protein
MDEHKQHLIDIQNLKKYPEFYAFKKHMEEFCANLDSLSDLQRIHDKSISLEAEIIGRIWARDKIKDELSSLGLVDKRVPITKDRTME